MTSVLWHIVRLPVCVSHLYLPGHQVPHLYPQVLSRAVEEPVQTLWVPSHFDLGLLFWRIGQRMVSSADPWGSHGG